MEVKELKEKNDPYSQYIQVGKRTVLLAAIHSDISKKSFRPTTSDPDIILLAEDIRLNGLKNFIVVELVCKHSGPEYKVLNGNHRLVATRDLLGWKEAPVLIVVKFRKKKFSKADLIR